MRSIYREFINLAETLEEVGRKGNLQGKEVFSARIIWCWRASLRQVPQNWKFYSIW